VIATQHAAARYNHDKQTRKARYAKATFLDYEELPSSYTARRASAGLGHLQEANSTSGLSNRDYHTYLGRDNAFLGAIKSCDLDTL